MVNKKNWAPGRGDIVWLDFDPQSGSEQAGHRPALVISPGIYNSKVGLALFCPITKQVKNYPFEVELPPGLKTSGVILSDHIKSLDCKARNASFIEKAPNYITSDVLARISALLT